MESETPKRKSMWEISNEYWERTVDAENYPQDEDLIDALKESENELIEKAANYVKLIHFHEAELSKLEKEVKRLDGLKTHHKSVIESRKKSLLNAVTVFGDIKTTFFRISARESKKIVVDDPEKVPPWFKTTPLPSIDKAKIKEAMKSGEEVEGCRIETSDYIVIK